MIERQFYLRVVSGVLRVAQASACPGRILAHSPSDVCSGWMSREFAVWSYSETRSTCNGYSVIVSAEGHGSVNELVAHHLVLSGVLRDAQTPANRHHSYSCIAHRPQNVNSRILWICTRRFPGRHQEVTDIVVRGHMSGSDQ